MDNRACGNCPHTPMDVHTLSRRLIGNFIHELPGEVLGVCPRVQNLFVISGEDQVTVPSWGHLSVMRRRDDWVRIRLVKIKVTITVTVRGITKLRNSNLHTKQKKQPGACWRKGDELIACWPRQGGPLL